MNTFYLFVHTFQVSQSPINYDFVDTYIQIILQKVFQREVEIDIDRLVFTRHVQHVFSFRSFDNPEQLELFAQYIKHLADNVLPEFSHCCWYHTYDSATSTIPFEGMSRTFHTEHIQERFLLSDCETERKKYFDLKHKIENRIPLEVGVDIRDVNDTRDDIPCFILHEHLYSIDVALPGDQTIEDINLDQKTLRELYNRDI